MGGFTVQILLGSLSSPEDGIVRITLLTQVKKERKERQTSVRASKVYLSFLYNISTLPFLPSVVCSTHVGRQPVDQ